MALDPSQISAICNDRNFKYITFSDLIIGDFPPSNGQVIGYNGSVGWVDLGNFSTQINSMQAQLNAEAANYTAISNAATQLNNIEADIAQLTEGLTDMDELMNRLIALSWASLVTPTPLTLDLTGLGIPQPTPANPNYSTYTQFIIDGWEFIGLVPMDT